jgi:hypothetical protein
MGDVVALDDFACDRCHEERHYRFCAGCRGAVFVPSSEWGDRIWTFRSQVVARSYSPGCKPRELEHHPGFLLVIEPRRGDIALGARTGDVAPSGLRRRGERRAIGVDPGIDIPGYMIPPRLGLGIRALRRPLKIPSARHVRNRDRGDLGEPTGVADSTLLEKLTLPFTLNVPFTCLAGAAFEEKAIDGCAPGSE